MSDFSQLPAELRNSSRWVCWRLEDSYVKGKLERERCKVPIQPGTWRRASSIDPDTWSMLDDVLKYADAVPPWIDPITKAAKYAVETNSSGIGLIIAEPYIAVDLDKVRDPETGVTQEWALELIRELNTYTELSPSGKGFHCWLRGKLPTGKDGVRTGDIEVYGRKRYFTVTGDSIGPAPVPIRKLTDPDVNKLFSYVEAHRHGGKPAVLPAQQNNPAGARQAQAQKYALLKEGDLKAAGFDDVSAAVQSFLTYSAYYHLLDKAKIDADFKSSKLHVDWRQHGRTSDWTEKWARLGPQEIDKACEQARAWIERDRSRTGQRGVEGKPRTLSVSLTSASFDTIEAKTIPWLFKGYLPKGMLVTVFAPKGRGKTKFVDYISACVSNGEGWPDGVKTDPGVVLRFNLEDPAEYILRPSLQAAGADLTRIRFMERNATAKTEDGEQPEAIDFSQPAMVKALQDHVIEHHVQLVAVEPVNNYKGGASANSEDDMRPIYTALATVAETTGCCVLAINHTNKKKDVNVLEKSLGAGSATAVARANFFLEKNPDFPDERILTDAGSNLPIGPSLVFKIESAPVFTIGLEIFNDVGVMKYVRQDEITGDELLERTNDNKKTESDQIANFITELLEKGEEIPTEKVKAMAASENREWTWNNVRQVFRRRKLGEVIGAGSKTKWKKVEDGKLEY